MKLVYNNSVVDLYSSENKYLFEYKDNIYKPIKLDDRYLLESEKRDSVILYPYEFTEQNNKVQNELEPYMDFIENHLHCYEHIAWCKRCGFGVFEHLSEGNHGGWYSECDNYPESCSDSIYKKYDVQCQRCDYGLCDACENNNFNEDKLEFNILRNAVMCCISELGRIDNLVIEFPSEKDAVSEIITWLDNYSICIDDVTDHREVWTFCYESDFKSVRNYLKSLY